MTGKEKCKILKEIRNKIAQENGIDFVASECTFEGECAGHCPQCDSEALFLENALKKLGKLGTEEESAFSEFLYRQELIEKIMVRVPIIEGYADEKSQESSVKLLTEMGITKIDTFEYIIK